ncbi:MAG: right-handed parallel beta-helix repeat-containing protein, partial [Clostridia bacterium]|nr:right-handed parallel beta-helix repeat-containing protein [Clostridia bacterium]
NLKVNGRKLAYQTWHHVKIVIDTDTEETPGSISFYVNDEKIAEGYSKAGITVGNLDDFSYLTSYSNGAGAFPYLIDNIKVTAVSGVLSDKTVVTSSVYQVSEDAISGVEAGTDAADVKANLTPAPGASGELYSAYDAETGIGTVRTGAVQEGDKYVVTAQNGTSKAVYTVVLVKNLLPFEQNFDSNLDQVTLNGFTTVVRPENNAAAPFEGYTPNGSKNGAAQSSMENGKKLKIDFGGGATGQLVFEGQFRYEGQEAASSAIKFFDLYDKNGKCLLMFTIGNSSKDGFNVRPVHKTAEGTGVTSPMGGYLAYQIWHTLRVEIDTERGVMNVFVDGNQLVTDGYPWGTATADSVAYVESYHSAANHTVPFLIDCVKLYENDVEDEAKKDATATSKVYTVGEDSISAIPAGTTAAEVVGNITVRAGAQIAVYSDYAGKILREGAVETGDVLEVTSPDGTVTKQYTLQLLVIRSEYYVAPDGDDAAEGSLEHPFATLNQAKNAVRSAKESGQPMTVYLKAGVYPMTETVAFDAGDSGTADAPITYRAYGDGKVIFKGSKQVDSALVTKVTDQAVLSRVISDYAKDKLVQLDLKAAGIMEIPDIPLVYGYAYGGYRPMEVYLNGSALKEARWPNGNTFLRVTDTDGKQNGFMMQYADETNRAAFWTKAAEQGDIYIGGTPGQTYAFQHIRLASIDPENRKVIAAGSTNYVPNKTNGKFYFANLLEEIDLPGESYLDREKGILYFYPNCDLSGAEIEVSVFDQTAVTLTGTSYVNFQDLTFSYTRNNMISASGVSHITIDGCEFSHNSSNAVTLNGTDCTIQNCHIYDLGGAAATGAIHLSGGDRKTLTPSGNKILNNRMHLGDRVYQVGQAPLIRAQGVGHVIEHNEIYDGSAYVVQLLSANNIQFNYNEVYDAVRMSSDAGALTWGRDTTLLGFEVKYNYFHNMGNPHGGVGQQSIFYDDGATGPYAYGNIFYRGSLTANEIPSNSNNYSAVKTNGGRYGVFENNVFVESYGAVYFQPWNSPANRWWKYVNDVYSSGSANMFQKMTAVDFFGDTWKTYYKDTQWAPLWEHFDEESHLQAQTFFIAGNTAALDELAAKKENGASNVFQNNVVVNVTIPQNSGEGFTGNGIGSNTYRKNSDKLSSGASIFTEYGKDFSLTEEGLREVKKTIPAFENIPTDQIGLQAYQRGEQTLYVGGRAPSASSLTLSGSTKPGGVMTAGYRY